MRRLIHKPVALAGRQRRSFVPTGLRLPQPRPAGAFVNKPHPFPNFLPDLLFAELDAHNCSRRRTPIRTAKGTTVASRPRSKKERALMRAVLPASIFLKESPQRGYLRGLPVNEICSGSKNECPAPQ